MRQTKAIIALILAIVVMCTMTPFTSAEVTNVGINSDVARTHSTGEFYYLRPQNDMQFATSTGRIPRRLPNWIVLSITRPTAHSVSVHVSNAGFDTIDAATIDCVISDAYGPQARPQYSQVNIQPFGTKP